MLDVVPAEGDVLFAIADMVRSYRGGDVVMLLSRSALRAVRGSPTSTRPLLGVMTGAQQSLQRSA